MYAVVSRTELRVQLLELFVSHRCCAFDFALLAQIVSELSDFPLSHFDAHAIQRIFQLGQIQSFLGERGDAGEELFPLLLAENQTLPVHFDC